ncbi:MAG: hypothetical protein WBO49_04700 [Candidatus Saccharimonas sp.]
MVTVKKRSRWTMPIVAVVFLFVTILQLFSPAITYAKTVDDIHDINYKYYASRYLRDCLAGLDSRLKNSIPLAALNENTWLTGGDHKVITGYIFEPTDGLAGCGETGLVKTAMMSLGYENDPGKLLTDIGYTKQGANFIRPASGDTMNVTIVDKLQQPNYARYVYYQKLFVDNCKLVEPPAGNGEDVTVNKAVLGDDGNWSVKPVTMRWQDASVHGTVNNPDYRVSSVTCDNLLKSLSDVLVNSVVAYNNAHKDDPITDKAAGETDDCNKDSPGWNAETKTCDEEKKTKITCAIEGIGWFVCPTLTFIARISDQAYGFVASTFLQVEPGMIDDAKDAWARFRDVANILFVIAFLIVVFSQLTSIGISNYGIKKMLPRIVVAAVLVNVSFLICQIAVDLSNILGYGIASFIDTAFKLTSPSDTATEAGVGFVSATATVLAAAAGIALALSIPVLISALLAIGLAVLILIGRKVVILLLVVVAPLAFVAFLLPNTEKLFDKWRNLFIAMLLVFPNMGALFGAGKLAGGIFVEVAKTNPPFIWAALFAMTMPFVLLLPLLKSQLNQLGKLGAKISGMMDKRLDKVKSNINDNSLAGAYKKQWDRSQQIKNSQVIAGQYKGYNPLRRVASGANRFINKSPLTGSLGNKITAAGASTALALKNEDIENEMKSMQAAWGPGEELSKATEAYEAALESNDTTKARAAQKILLSKGGAGVRSIRSVVQKGKFNKDSEAVKAARSDLSAAGLKSKDAGLNAWSYDSKNRDLATLDGEAGTYSALTESELSTQSHGSMIRAVNSGGVSGTRAKNILDNATLDANLTEDTRDVLRRAHQGIAQKRDPDAP